MNAPATFDRPALRPEDGLRRVQRLGGHSGAEVVLCAASGQSFVRKTSAARSGNLRLRRQAIKQRLLAAQGFAFPAVRRIGLDDGGRAFFEMDYVPARTLGEIVAGAVPCDRARIVAAVGSLIDAFAASAAGTIAAAQFHDKIDAVAAQARARPDLQGHAGTVALLRKRLLACDWSGIPQSPDHGDLTLENILLPPDGRPVFIDCDVAWVSSWWLDLAKLFQDLEGRWCLRAVPAPSVDALERLRLLAQDFRVLAREMDAALPPRLGPLAALHLFRTLPYARSAAAAAFACDAAVRLLAGSPA